MLLTKIHIPALRENIVPRSRLFEKLNDGLQRKLILVSATAGYGKTTVVCDWIKHYKIPTAWFSIDHRDNDPMDFLSFVVHGIQTIHSNIGKRSLELINSQGGITKEYIVELLINDILSVQSDFLLVLDDLHAINSQEIFDILNILIEHKPRNLKIAILTRSDPPLPLSRLRSQNELVEIRSFDLSFTGNDINEFFNKKLKLGLSDENISIVETKTEGWIAGLQLAAISLKERDNISEFINGIAGYNRYIMDYLIEEVLNIQRAEIKDFLLKTSILEELSGSLCDAVMHKENSQVLLEYMEKNNVFIISLDSNRKWFRYHHLFKDLLKQKLTITNKEVIPDLHNKASIWFEKNDIPLMAVEHALQAGNIKKGLKLIDEIIDYLVETSQYSLILRYAKLFSDKDIISNIKFGILYAWSLTITGRLAEAEKILTKIETKIPKESYTNETEGLLGTMYTTYTLLKDFMGDTNSALKYADLAVKYTPEDDMVWNAWAYYCKAGPHLLRLELDESISSLSKGLDYATKTNNAYLEIVHNKIAYLLRLKGNYSEALNICNEMLKNSDYNTNKKGKKINFFASALYSTLGSIFVEQGKINEGIEMALKGFELSQKLVSISFRGYSRYLLAETYYKAGESQNALDIIDKHDANLESNTGHWLSVLSCALKLKLLSRMGKVEEAGYFYNKLIKPANNHHFEYCLYGIASACYFISTGRYDEANPILMELSSELNNKKVLELLTEVELMKVKIFMMTFRENDAANCIRELLTITQNEGIIRMYIIEGDEIEKIIKEIKREKSTHSSQALNSISNNYLNELLDAFSKEKIIRKHTEDDILSSRELDTLKLMAENYTNREIADQLYISINTVKTHVSNIFLRLEANNRLEAVEKARGKGII